MCDPAGLTRRHPVQQLHVRRPGLEVAHSVNHAVLLVGRMGLVFILGSAHGRVRRLLED